MSANDTSTSGVREQRRAAGLSQQQLATRAGCSVSMVRLVESGYRPEGPSAVLGRIEAALTADGSEGAAHGHDH
ncbi:helix-turn-helix domain-containing protein [Solirubrobacter phytolaccae]|uniref:helix-turn-helix domain-containing protein n=1 Tax=Solirubrobacter phytolaccae TaxID=1404360 RepID=UPI003556F0CF